MDLTWLDLLIIVIVIAAGIRGFFTGFILQLAFFAGIILGAMFAGQVAERIHPYINGIIGNTEHIASPVSYIVAFILILVLVNIIGRLINKFATIVLLGLPNKIAGAAFCVLKWILISSIVLNILVQFDANQSIVKKEVRENSQSYPLLTKIAQVVIPYLRFDGFTSPKTNNPLPQAVSV